MTDLTGKVALVTGGGRNVGAAISRMLVDRGAHVLINYFHAHEAAVALRDELRKSGGEVDLLRASVARAEQVERMFAQVQTRYGGIDILINNAADGALVAVGDVTDAHLDRAIDTNLKGALRCSRAAAPLMAARGGGAIVMVSALGGSSLVMANYLAAAPAKAAVETLARYLAVEYAPLNVRVNTASAAMLRSEVAGKFPDAAAMQRAIEDATPFGRLGEPAELAKVVVFLASDEASWVTGQVVLADGGLSLGATLLSPASAAPTEPAVEANAAGVANAAVDIAELPVEEAAEIDSCEIAVVGMGLAVAGANTPEEFWKLRMTGAELFVPVPEDRWERGQFHSSNAADEDKSYQDTCVFITDFVPQAGSEDAVRAAGTDREFTTAWLRHSLVQAMDGVTTTAEDNFSFTIGYTPDGSQHLEEAGVLLGAERLVRSVVSELDLPQGEREQLVDGVREALSERYWRGRTAPSRFMPHQVGQIVMQEVLPDDTELQMVDTACSSSLYAIDIGMKGLLTGKHDVAVCGGAFALAPRGTVLFSKLQGLSKRGTVNSLDKAADGVIFADGAAVVVLKRLDRAHRDGDQVLGVLKAFGSSSDGKGKAVYAPNSAGQHLAVERALSGQNFEAGAVDWVNAHATGTPAGDQAEFATLRRHYGRDEKTFVTSNKSLIGHTGWAAGVVSLIESLLGLRHELIPDQPRFVEAPAEFNMAETKLEIPTECQPWPMEDGGQRLAAISGFGFGGTNAHLLVSEPRAGVVTRPAAAPAQRSRVAIVGWSAHVPGLDTAADVSRWVRGEVEPAESFGEHYPAPPFKRVKLPPSTVRTIDRCQLMILECAHKMRDQMPEFWADNAARTGVVVGHMGPTRAAMLYAYRCYLDDIGSTLAVKPAVAGSESFAKLTEALRQRVRALIPPSSEDAFPGMMPNIISARVANYFDLKGPNMTVDSGLASTLSAIETASRYVRSGEVDLALVGGINGNSLPEYADLLAELRGVGAPDLAEGAFLFALTSEETAARAGLPVLGYVDEFEATSKMAVGDDTVDCGALAPERARYLGAAGGVGLLQALFGPARAVTLQCDGDRPGIVNQLRIEVTGALAPVQQSPTVDRYVVELAELPASEVRGATHFLPAGTALITDAPELVVDFDLPADCVVISTNPIPAARPGWTQLDEVTVESIAKSLSPQPKIQHVRLLIDLSKSAPPDVAGFGVSDSLLRLHDAAYLALQQRYDQLSVEGSSVIGLLLGAVDDGVPHPATGLVTGLFKTAYLELPDSVVFVLGTASGDFAESMRAVEGETRLHRPMPVVFLDGAERKAPRLVPESVSDPHAGAIPLDGESVVVAVGGARGITAEVLIALAEAVRPRLYLLGSNRISDYPAEVFEGTDEAFASSRAAFIRAGRAADRPRAVAELNREFERRLDARAARRNIDRMTFLSGVGRVTYLPCDARDENSVKAVIDEVLTKEGGIDLLVNAAGRNRSARIRDKDFAEFAAIRDLKVRTYRNLKRALAGRPPRLWCNFGSLLGYFGQIGEADYAAANDALATASVAANARAVEDGPQEFTIGWTLWDGVGMGAGELTKAYFQRAGSYSHMPVAEGCQHFLDELAAPIRRGSVVHLGLAERKTVESFYPGYLEPDASTGVSGTDGSNLQNITGRTRRGGIVPAAVVKAGSDRQPPAPFYLRREVELTAEAGTWECAFDLDADSYLSHHLVRGIPTLPGTFITEMAAEAATRLVPDAKVIGLQDLTFHNFLRVHESTNAPPRRIRAEVLGREGDVIRVGVRISADVVAPSGPILVRDKLHFSTTVLLSAQFPIAPSWQPWGDGDEIPVPDPYHSAGSPVSLSGPFDCTSNTRLHPLGKRAHFVATNLPGPLGGRFTTPVILLDAMARTGVLSLIDGTLVPIAAPLSIRRIELYESADDRSLMAEYGSLELYATPAGYGMDVDEPVNRLVAATPGGRMVAQIKDIAATVIGYVDAATGVQYGPDRLPDPSASTGPALASAGYR